MPSALEEALAACESLLESERHNGASDALLSAKDAAIERLAQALSQASSLDQEEAERLAPRLQSLLAANRFSLKWSALRAKLGQIGQPKPSDAASAARPRIDLVH